MTEVGTFAGKDPNHEPSRNYSFCGYTAMVNAELINFPEEKNDQTTHLPFTETLTLPSGTLHYSEKRSEQTVLIPNAELKGSR
jgi:hypothetical protein